VVVKVGSIQEHSVVKRLSQLNLLSHPWWSPVCRCCISSWVVQDQAGCFAPHLQVFDKRKDFSSLAVYKQQLEAIR